MGSAVECSRIARRRAILVKKNTTPELQDASKSIAV